MKVIETQSIENKDYDPRMFIENPRYNPRTHIELKLFQNENKGYFWGFLNCEVQKKLFFEEESIVRLNKLGFFKTKKEAILQLKQAISKINSLKELI